MTSTESLKYLCW